jgi:hypothetical protein
MKRASRDLAFLRNHREAIAAMGFFTVPTITFGVLYCFSSSATAVDASCTSASPRIRLSLWVVQQLREAFPFELAPRFLIFDRDANYRVEVPVAQAEPGTIRPNFHLIVFASRLHMISD